MLHPTTTPTPARQTATDDLDLEAVDSVALRRLIEEVRNTGGSLTADGTAYNRTYHRHNR
jgi:hypothetical protein